ncbi:hypothetical protein Y882_08440 [Dyella japonica DSM 16301]|uniref:Uncharacterized protein n=2 Tax=Dyella japonica TaxID=231455 RepID=A0A0G9H3L9_9GAMM|nr:hypothetical protein Y882_08440 [Dyella japonica DSM 16301]
MNEENSKHLCAAYPELYGAQFAFACPDSWAPLLHEFSKELLEHIRATGLTVTITDVKEKHKELRICADGTDARADEIIEIAEQSSRHIPAEEYPYLSRLGL